MAHSQPARASIRANSRASAPEGSQTRAAPRPPASARAVTIRCLSTGGTHAGQSTSKPPLQPGIDAHRYIHCGLDEIGRERVTEIQLGIRQIPQEKIADALLAGRANA